MSAIRVTLTDDEFRSIEHVYDLPGPLNTLDEIEEAVDQFKNECLPVVEQALLEQAQERLVAQQKGGCPS